MEETKKGLSPILIVLIGLTISAILGWILAQLLIGKPHPYRSNLLWKFTILFYCLTGFCTIWFYFSKRYFPILLNLLKFVAGNFLLSLPLFVVIILRKASLLDDILIILPAQFISLAAGFILYVSIKVDPDIYKYSNKYASRSFLVMFVVIGIAVFLKMNETVCLSLATLVVLITSLFVLKQAKRNKLE